VPHGTVRKLISEKELMSKDQNTFLKRQREMEKKRKAEEKRARRRKKKEAASADNESDIASPSDAEQ